MDPTQDTCGPDIRTLQALLDSGVTNPALLFGALPTSDTPATTEAIRELSEQALDDYEACSTPGRRGCGRCDACADWLHDAEADR